MKTIYEGGASKETTSLPADIIIVAGQSNATGYGQGGEAFTPIKGAYFAFPKCTFSHPNAVLKVEYEDAMRLSDNCEFVAGSMMAGFAPLYLGRDLGTGRILLGVVTAMGSSGFAHGEWRKGGALREKAFEAAEWAKELCPGSRVTALLWHQGEQDARAYSTAEECKSRYIDDFTSLVNEFRARYGNIPVIAGGFSPRWRVTVKFAPTVEEATAEVCRAVGNAAFVCTDGIPDSDADTGCGDTIHFSRRGQKMLGERYYEAYSRLKAENRL